MSSGNLRNLRRSLAARLTVWYGGVFVVSSLLAFTLVYGSIVATLRHRTDEDLEEDVAELAALWREEGLERVRGDLVREAEGEEGARTYFRIWSPEGQPLFAAGLGWPEAVSPELLAQVEPDAPQLRTLTGGGDGQRLRAVLGVLAPGLIVEIGQSLEEDEDLIAAFRTAFLVAVAAIVLLGAPVGWFLARRALHGVQDLTRTAAAISAGALDRRVPVHGRDDELDVLARTFNRMLDRIQALVAGMNEMTDNLAHDFRSPLARLRTAAETAGSGTASREDWEHLAAKTAEECDRLLEMIDTTLDIAEAESGAARLRRTEVDLAALARDACDLFKTVAEDRGIALEADLPHACAITGDRSRLQRVVANILDNALKYTGSGGKVTVRLVDEGARAALSVEDTGVGLAPEELPRIFQRFYRGDRSRSGNGSGLGLSLALAFVRAHDGSIEVASTAGRGSRFTVILPRNRRGDPPPDR